MDSLVGYGSDDEVENERYGGHQSAGDHSGGPGGSRRRDDDTNYDDVNMDMSEEGHVLPQDSQTESEPELPQAEPAPSRHERRDDRKRSPDSRERNARRDSPRRERERRDSRGPRHDDRYRGDRSDRGRADNARRGLLGDRPDRPDDRPVDNKPPALMDLKPFGGDPPPGYDNKCHDARDAASPRFTERDRRDKDRERDRERDNRHSRRSEERRHKQPERRSRSRSRGAAPGPSSQSSSSSSSERRVTPPSEYRPSSYKVNKKLEVMEKMGLQIKTPSGSMATAQQLRAAAADLPRRALPSYYNPAAAAGNKVLDQVNKRKLLWANKAKNEQEEAAKWSGTRFAQDNDGKQVSKFMRLMGIKDPAAVKPEPDKTVDPIKKQEELFQAMQAQYEVARATTHTMRGVGLGFQRGQF